MKMAKNTTSKVYKETLKNGIQVRTTITTTFNKCPGKTPCAMSIEGCKGTAKDGEWFCPDCLKKLDKFSHALAKIAHDRGLTKEEVFGELEFVTE